MPKNFFLNSFREVLEDLSQKATGEGGMSAGHPAQGTDQRQCDNAKGSKSPHGKVTVFCMDCAEFYCESCESNHRMFRATKGHQMKPADEIDTTTVLAVKQQTRIPRCEQHPTQHINLYCDTCHIPVCTTCCVLTHKQHDYRELVTAAQEFRDRLTSLDKAAAGHREKLNKHLKQLHTSEQDIQKDVNKAHQEVDQAADQMVALVNKRRQYLHHQIDDIQKTALEEVRAACKETELNEASIQSLQSYMQALQVSGNITDQVVHAPGLQEQLHQQKTALLKAETWTAKFKTETNSVDALDAMLGTVGVDHSFTLGCPLQTVHSPLAEGVAVVGDVVCAVWWCNEYLRLCNTKSGTKKQHTVSGLSTRGVAAIDSSTDHATLAVTDANRKLHFVTINANNMEITKHECKNIPFEPRHIKVNSITRKLLIANYTDKEIVICDNTGSIESRVKVQAEMSIMKCAVASQGLHAVLDFGHKGKICWVDSQGRVAHTYGQGDGEGLRYPEDMVSDSLGHLVVADRDNHRLHLIDANKQLSSYVLTEAHGIKEPTAVCLDEATSQLYVACKNANDQYVINVYKWPPTDNSTTYTHHTLQVKLCRYK